MKATESLKSKLALVNSDLWICISLRFAKLSATVDAERYMVV